MELIPTKTNPSNHRQPWITCKIKNLSWKKQHAYNHARLTNTPSNWLHYNNIIKQSRQACHTAYNNYISNLIDPNTKAVSKRLWTLIKNKKLDHTGVGPLIHNGTTYTDPGIKLI